jgi:exo-beta-1,3-glucanase (GH17 family)
VTRFDYLASLSGKPVVLKEVGFPTGGDPCCSEEMQHDLFERMLKSGVEFFFFEAFDQPHKLGPAVERYWGLLRADGSPKRVHSVLRNWSQPR